MGLGIGPVPPGNPDSLTVEPDQVADDLGREPVALRSVRSLAHAGSLHFIWNAEAGMGVKPDRTTTSIVDGFICPYAGSACNRQAMRTPADAAEPSAGWNRATTKSMPFKAALSADQPASRWLDA